MSEVENQVEQAEQPAGPSLSLADLLIVVQAIQIGAGRGAYKAEEFTQIGGAFERVVAFLEASGAIVRSDSTQASAEAPADSESNEA